MQDSWLQLQLDNISWRKTLKNSHNSQIQGIVVSTLCQETKFYLNLNVGSEGTPKLVPCWKLQPVAYKVNMEWKSELSLWTKTILTRGKEFLMAWISWSRTKTKTSRSKAKAKPQRRDLASSSTGYWTRRIFALRLSSVEETDQSSSSW